MPTPLTPDSELVPLSLQLASAQLQTTTEQRIEKRSIFIHIETITLSFLPVDQYVQPPPPGAASRFYNHHTTWHLGFVSQTGTPEYASKPVDLTTKALSCFLEKSFYSRVKQSEERINALSCFLQSTRSSEQLSKAHKILLDTFWKNAITIEEKACQLLDSAGRAGLNLRHHDELFPLIMDGFFHHVGRHAFDNAPQCLLALLDGIKKAGQLHQY